MNENEAVRDRFTMACTVEKVLDHVIFKAHNFQKCFMKFLSTEVFFFFRNLLKKTVNVG